MSWWTTKEAKDVLFRILFVMRDSPHYSREALRNTIIIFTVDIFQVLRTLLTPAYGWSSNTFSVARWIDVVSIGETLVSAAIPRVSLFVGAFLMVFIAVGDAIYCGYIFRAGEIRSMLPIRLLRFLVTVVVTTLYSSTIKWLLMPIECLISSDNSLFEVLHGENAPCAPWSFPGLAITLPTLVLAVLYVSFATTACYFSLGVNAVSKSSRYAYTGRVEVWFIATKVALVFAPYIARHTSLALSPAVVLLCASRTLYMHNAMHPFQSPVINMLRGAGYCAIIWLSLWSIILCGLAEVRQQQQQPDGGEASGAQLETAELVGVGIMPLVGVLGAFLVNSQRQKVFRTLEAMKEAFEALRREQELLADADASALMSVRAQLRASLASPTKQSVLASFMRARDKRWFATGRAAVATARVLLARREENDEKFLAFVVTEGMREHPACMELKVLNISLLRVLMEEHQAAVKEERALRNQDLPLDLEYLLFAVDRKAAQDYNAEILGKEGSLSVLQALEFDQKIRKAREAHIASVTELCGFWRGFAEQRPARQISLAEMQAACDHLERSQRMQDCALREYHSLRVKYPMSVQLLYAFASFAEIVLNDSYLHRQLRHEIDMLEDGSDKDGGATGKGDGSSRVRKAPEQQVMGSTTGGSTVENSATNLLTTSQFATSLIPLQGMHLLRLYRAGAAVLVALLVLFILKIVVADVFLYGRLARAGGLGGLSDKAAMLPEAVTLCFLCRTLQLAAWGFDAQRVRAVQAELAATAKAMQDRHYLDYISPHDDRVEEGFLAQHAVMRVVGLSWQPASVSFLELGRELPRAALLVAGMSAQQLRAANASAAHMTPEQAALAFINENMFRAIVPAMENMMDLYVDETGHVWNTAQAAIASGTAVDLTFFVFLAVLTITALNLVHSMHSSFLAILLAISLPQALSAKLYVFYERQEAMLWAFEDEGDAIRLVVEEADALEAKGLGSPGTGSSAGAAAHEGMEEGAAAPQQQSPIIGALTERNLRTLSHAARQRTIWGAGKGASGHSAVNGQPASGIFFSSRRGSLQGRVPAGLTADGEGSEEVAGPHQEMVSDSDSEASQPGPFVSIDPAGLMLISNGPLSSVLSSNGRRSSAGHVLSYKSSTAGFNSGGGFASNNSRETLGGFTSSNSRETLAISLPTFPRSSSLPRSSSPRDDGGGVLLLHSAGASPGASPLTKQPDFVGRFASEGAAAAGSKEDLVGRGVSAGGDGGKDGAAGGAGGGGGGDAEWDAGDDLFAILLKQQAKQEAARKAQEAAAAATVAAATAATLAATADGAGAGAGAGAAAAVEEEEEARPQPGYHDLLLPVEAEWAPVREIQQRATWAPSKGQEARSPLPCRERSGSLLLMREEAQHEDVEPADNFVAAAFLSLEAVAGSQRMLLGDGGSVEGNSVTERAEHLPPPLDLGLVEGSLAEASLTIPAEASPLTGAAMQPEARPARRREERGPGRKEKARGDGRGEVEAAAEREGRRVLRARAREPRKEGRRSPEALLGRKAASIRGWLTEAMGETGGEEGGSNEEEERGGEGGPAEQRQEEGGGDAEHAGVLSWSGSEAKDELSPLHSPVAPRGFKRKSLLMPPPLIPSAVREAHPHVRAGSGLSGAHRGEAELDGSSAPAHRVASADTPATDVNNAQPAGRPHGRQAYRPGPPEPRICSSMAVDQGRSGGSAPAFTPSSSGNNMGGDTFSRTSSGAAPDNISPASSVHRPSTRQRKKSQLLYVPIQGIQGTSAKLQPRLLPSTPNGRRKSLLQPTLRHLPSMYSNASSRTSTLRASSGLHRSHSVGTRHQELSDLQEEGSVVLRTLRPQDIQLLDKAVHSREPAVLRKRTQVTALLVILTFALLHTILPAIRMRGVANLAPSINQAARRRSLMRSCVHFARELRIGDNSSRMGRDDVASALRFHVSELERADRAVRLGGDLGVGRGADERGKGGAHGEIMYLAGCPWRADPSNCSTPERAGAAENGLHALTTHFTQAVEELLAKYWPPPQVYSEAFRRNPRSPAEVSAADDWDVPHDEERLAVEEDASMSFLLSSFEGDLYQGLDAVVGVFDGEARSIVAQARADNRLYFVLSLLLLLGFFGLFRRTHHHGTQRQLQGFNFANGIPLTSLSPAETSALRTFLSSKDLITACSRGPLYRQCCVSHLSATEETVPGQ